MQSELRDTKRNKSMGLWGCAWRVDYSKWSFLLLFGWIGCYLRLAGFAHIEVGEMDTPEPRNKLRMVNSKSLDLLEYLEKVLGELFCKPEVAINKILSYLFNYSALVTGSIL